MRTSIPIVSSVCCAAAWLVAVAAFARPSATFVDRLLVEKMEFSRGNLQAFDEGAAIIKSLDTPIREELAHVGAVYVDAPAGTFVERFRDIVAFESGPGIPQIGRFTRPPRPENLSMLTLPRKDVPALETCRPGDCEMKLSAEAMTRFHNDVDWSASDAEHQADLVARSMILEIVRAYQTEGNAALGHYDDGKQTLFVAEQFRAILGNSDPLPIAVPELLAYLDEYPHSRLPGAEDFFYWTVVDFGLRETIRVNHVVIYSLNPSASAPGARYVIAIKQLYASHYFHTTLELRFLIDDDRHERPGTSLISVTRARNDGMTGFKGLFLRRIIRRRSRDAVRSYLNQVKKQVERPEPVTPAVAPSHKPSKEPK